MPTIYIENKPYQVNAGQNMLEACLSLKFDIPYFCWHPAMHSVGACRMCAVKQFKDQNDTQGQIVMSCMTPATEGTRISITDPEAVRFRKSVSEWLMVNHPHDCPVCDEGGECHLQDMTLLTGQVYRRYRFKKRTHRNQNLGPFVRHEMNRCIQCYRCVRFYQDTAGGRDFGVFGWNNGVYFGRHEDGVLQSEFSGNLVEVCPTGVFTDKTFANHYTRKWDLQTVPSICVHCGLGCNIIPGERYGVLRRIQNRFNGEVNGYFLCDRGRFGYEFVNSPRRIRQPVRRKAEQTLKPLSRAAAGEEIAGLLRNSHGVIGIGSGRASLESNFALRYLVGSENFYAGLSRGESELISKAIAILQNGSVRGCSLREVETADAVLVLGEDIPNVAPMLQLSLRKSALRKGSAAAQKTNVEEWNDAAFREAIQRERSPLFVATVGGTRLDGIATVTYRASPDDVARLGFAAAHEIDSRSPQVADLADDVRRLAQRIAADLKNAEKPVIVAGTTCRSKAVMEAAANVAYALHSMKRQAQLFCAMPDCNTMGLGLMGAQPIESAMQAVRDKSVDTVIILENDIYRHVNSRTVDEILNTAAHIIVIDCLETQTTAKAHYVLPASTFAEGSGTLVNNEGRAQRFYKVFVPQGDIMEGWRWLREIALTCDSQPETAGWQDLDGFTYDLVREMPVFQSICEIAPSADFRIAGQKVPRQPGRCSGRTAIHANADVNEPQPPDDPDSALAFSMEGYGGQPPSPLVARFWAPSWNSVQSVNKYQDAVGRHLQGGDPGRRLIEPKPSAQFNYFSDIPEAFRPREDELWVVPAYHVFGSEELSALSPGIAELSAGPYVGINPEDAGRLRLADGQMVEVTLSGICRSMPVKVLANLALGVAAIPMGLPTLPWDGEPFWCKLAPR